MIKSIVVAHRKAGLTHEEYNKYWLEKHAPLAAKLIPGLRRYVQNHYVAIPGMEYQGDGIVEMWYDDVDAWRKSMAAVRSSKELAQDGANFCDLRNASVWIVEEHVIKE
ncbi:MAG: hypothetical protein A2Z15_00070 [Chloroflexi bacterium RBG_16_50_11]|nr:MAG: hypothetical protein A2Z15_00070 [Chloroflexi bacterium RBG_16_50_11]